MLDLYIFIFGGLLVLMGCIEAIVPAKSLALWRRWISHRLFFLHGAMLIVAGLPLTCAGGSSVGCIVFWLGVVMVFTGPFILLYADRVRSLFLSTVDELRPASARRLILIDAALRATLGLFMVFSYAHDAGF
ncbi:MAG TPA: hypothetical protein PKO25_10650 [Spirochaetota bacterium]|nr:hypothetical protein [Spirochaetota bacterium]OPZ39134.1 MAG: hypothetical protein BWY96_00556 [Spirochaetes bacterium ADurb.BinA120]HNU92318.1 hypothetical protein [Spirochaetota bacterium]HPI12976.1 hypothetical protein [Spirochaetota bacterium]HPV98100.1 hypothetical protein [Spirochaetota bacterium]